MSSKSRVLTEPHFRMSIHVVSHPKLIGAPAAAKWLWVAGFAVAAREKSDGILRPAVVCAEAEVPAGNVARLVERGLWHQPGHDCDTCVQPPAGMLVVHDYLDWQRSRDEIEADRAKKQAAGRKGASVRWHNPPSNGSRHSSRHDNSHDTPHGNRDDRTDGRTMADTDVDTEVVEQAVSQSPTTRRTRGLTDSEIGRIRQRLGTTSLTHAKQVATEVLARAEVTVMNPYRYVLAAIDAEPDRYRPTAGPPRKDDACQLPGHGSYLASSCGACRSELIATGGETR